MESSIFQGLKKASAAVSLKCSERNLTSSSLPVVVQLFTSIEYMLHKEISMRTLSLKLGASCTV